MTSKSTNETAVAKLPGLDQKELAALMEQGSQVDAAEQKDLQAAIGMGKITVKSFPKGTKLEVILIGHHRANAYWPGVYTGSTDPPACSAINGELGTGIISGEAVVDRECEGCPMNVFGSATNGKGKACRNYRIMYVIRMIDGQPNPFAEAIVVPPSGLKTAGKYLQDTIRKPRWMFKTNILVTEGTSGMGGFSFSQGEDIPVDDLPVIGALVKQYEASRLQTMQTGDGASREEAAAAGNEEKEF